jgi:hypothetical protein
LIFANFVGQPLHKEIFMCKTLHELTTGYAAATGCSCETEEGSGQATLSVEGFSVRIGLVESSGMIVFQTGMALVPLQGREEFCLRLLTANNLFTETLGFTLGVDAEQELVTLQLAWDISRLDAEGFARIVNNLFSVAADWMVRLDEWRPSAPGGESEASGEAPSTNLLRV